MSIAPLRPRLSRLCRRFVTLPAEPRLCGPPRRRFVTLPESSAPPCGPPRRPYATHRFDERGEHIATYGEPTSAYDRFLLARWLSRDDRRLKHRHDGRLATPAQQKRAAGRTDTRAYNFAAPVAAESAVEPYQWSFFGDLFGGSGSVGAPRSSKAARTFDEASVRELDVDQLDLLARFLVRCGAVGGTWSEHDPDGEGLRRALDPSRTGTVPRPLKEAIVLAVLHPGHHAYESSCTTNRWRRRARDTSFRRLRSSDGAHACSSKCRPAT